MRSIRTMIVGDVHGCVEELGELIERLAPSHGDKIHFLGDLVDRGPDSLGVVRCVRELLEVFPGSVCIAGNHEEKVLRYRERGRPLPGWAVNATKGDWAFLEGLPLVHRLPEFEAVMVHGGFFPAFFARYGDLGEVPADWRTAKGKRIERMRRFLRIRKVNPYGDMVSLCHEKAEHQPWAKVYDGCEGFVFYGHDAVIDPPQPVIDENAMNLDTGCCFGGRLSAAILEHGVIARQAQIMSVPARDTYASYLKRRA